ncbi:hypothetical protein Mapa_006483 [Marchantia paleacea]|nr:hypothetical protein Mapa_006483 [Marchantia paleacea]
MSISRSAAFYGGYNQSSWFSGHEETWNVRPIAVSNSGGQAEEKKQGSATIDEKMGIIELRVPLCCEGCVEKIMRKVEPMDGVRYLYCDQEKQKVVVRGDAKPQEVLKRAKQVLNRSEFWTEKR